MSIKIDHDGSKFYAKLGSLKIRDEDIDIIRRKIKGLGKQYKLTSKALKAWKNDRGV